MLVIAGPVYVDPADRDAYVEAFRDLVTASRAADGCLDVAVTADSIDPSRVNLYELWASDAQLQAWRRVAPVPRDSPAMLGDDVRKHEISSSGPPF